MAMSRRANQQRAASLKFLRKNCNFSLEKTEKKKKQEALRAHTGLPFKSLDTQTVFCFETVL